MPNARLPGAPTPHTRRQWLLAVSWLALLLLAGAWVGEHLQLSGDLRKFMPSARTPAQKLLIDELGEGPGSRLLLIGLSGADAQALAAQSAAMRERLAADPQFSLVGNGGEASLEEFPPALRRYRYLLSPTLDSNQYDAAFLAAALDERVQDLGSPAAALVEPLLASDPTLETLVLAEAWTPAGSPQRLHGVWFDAHGREALLVAQTHAAGFDPNGQQSAVAAIDAAFEEARGTAPTRLTLTGPGAFSVEIGGRTAGEARMIAGIGSAGLVLLFLLAYRSLRTLLLGALPLATAALAGLGAVTAAFDSVHGITLAFGFTLIGVAQDYPVHLFSHQRVDLAPRDSARALWPTLATGVASTCIAYLTFFASGVDGLKQLAVFTIAGLAVAALCTRYLLPPLMGSTVRDAADSKWMARCQHWIERLPRPRRALAALALVAAAVVALAPGDFWQNDLSTLTPVPEAAMDDDLRLRHALGAPDVRYVLTLAAADEEAALQASERLVPALDALVAQGALGGYDLAARTLPSMATQRTRQARLPAESDLRASLRQALAASPFREDAFEPFVADVAAARRAPPLRPADLDDTPLAARVSGLLLKGDERVTALVSLNGRVQAQAVAAAARANGAQLVDLKQASESLVAAYRGRVLGALAVAALLLLVTVWIALRSPRRVWRVVVPMALTTLLILAVLRGFGVELTLFHLVALILAAGLGLDYALFFEHAGDDRAHQRRTLHAVLVCSATTLLVFCLLSFSTIPVLRAIGTTVALGVFGNFVLALLIARAPLERDSRA
jgi:predicted exporter